jgi:hypothetical protein
VQRAEAPLACERQKQKAMQRLAAVLAEEPERLGVAAIEALRRAGAAGEWLLASAEQSTA